MPSAHLSVCSSCLRLPAGFHRAEPWDVEPWRPSTSCQVRIYVCNGEEPAFTQGRLFCQGLEQPERGQGGSANIFKEFIPLISCRCPHLAQRKRTFIQDRMRCTHRRRRLCKRMQQECCKDHGWLMAESDSKSSSDSSSGRRQSKANLPCRARAQHADFKFEVEVIAASARLRTRGRSPLSDPWTWYHKSLCYPAVCLQGSVWTSQLCRLRNRRGWYVALLVGPSEVSYTSSDVSS